MAGSCSGRAQGELVRLAERGDDSSASHGCEGGGPCAVHGLVKGDNGSICPPMVQWTARHAPSSCAHLSIIDDASRRRRSFPRISGVRMATRTVASFASTRKSGRRPITSIDSLLPMSRSTSGSCDLRIDASGHDRASPERRAHVPSVVHTGHCPLYNARQANAVRTARASVSPCFRERLACATGLRRATTTTTALPLGGHSLLGDLRAGEK